jgi:hypothetical protein
MGSLCSADNNTNKEECKNAVKQKVLKNNKNYNATMERIE